MRTAPVKLDRRNLLFSFAGHVFVFLIFLVIDSLFIPVREPVIHTVRLVQIPRSHDSLKSGKQTEIPQKKQQEKEPARIIQHRKNKKVEEKEELLLEKEKEKSVKKKEPVKKNEKKKTERQPPKGKEKKPIKPPPRKEKRKPDTEVEKEKDLLVANTVFPLGSRTQRTVSDIKADGSGELPSYFLELVRSKIGICWENPYSGQARKLEVVIGFRINRDGSLGKVKVEKRSGKQIFDQAATRSIYCAAPFPPVPASAGRGPLNIHFKFKFLGNGFDE